MLQVIDTPYGALEARWTNRGLYSCEFQRHNGLAATQAQTAAASCAEDTCGPLSDQLAQTLADYFATSHLSWDLQTLDWSGVPEFHRKVLRLCFDIRAGQTLTYGELAELAGSPKGARAVGSAMAKNRWPILIPCHRVVGANGQLTGYSGVGGLTTKQHLLKFESEHQLSVS